MFSNFLKNFFNQPYIKTVLVKDFYLVHKKNITVLSVLNLFLYFRSLVKSSCLLFFFSVALLFSKSAVQTDE